MKSFTCTNINKSSENKIISYELQDSTGKTLQVSYNKLKLMLESNKIAVVNLMIKKNKIVEDPSYQVKIMIAKSKMFGTWNIETYKSDCGHKYYVIERSDTTIVYIPDDVEYLINSDDNYCGKPDFCNINCKTLRVIGGSGLASTYHMFCECEAQSIDFSSFDTSNITSMNNMFAGCKTKSLDLSSFDTSKVTDMSSMFYCCEAQSIDLSSFDTSNVTNMKCMFCGCEIDYEFIYCKVKSLDLRSFDTSKVKSMWGMFYECKAQSIDLNSFDTSKVTNMYEMFDDCKAQVKSTDRKILRKLG